MTYGQRLTVLAEIDRICINARIFLDLLEKPDCGVFVDTYCECYRKETGKLLAAANALNDDSATDGGEDGELC